MKKISILIPVYNEESNLKALNVALEPLINNELTSKAYDWEVIVIDDGSKDDSLRIMNEIHERDSRYTVVELSRNFGKEAAMLAGFDISTGDGVVIIDADLQHPISAIPQMIELWEEGFDDVYGHRRTRSTDSFIRRNLSKIYYKVLSGFSKNSAMPDAGDFRLMSRRFVNSLRKLRESQRYTKNLYCYIGYKKAEVFCDYADRHAGRSSFSIPKLINFAIEGLTSNTTLPLRFATFSGVLSIFSSLVYVIIALIASNFNTIIFLMLFIGGIQLLSLGVIGEYLSRIFLETKGRPLYFISSINGQTVF